MLLQISNISKSFDGTDILSDCSFHIEENEKCALVGSNGTGKSTLLKIIAGRIPSDSGSISLKNGADIGYLAQQDAVDTGNTIIEELTLVKQSLIDEEAAIRQLERDMKDATGRELEEMMDKYSRLTHHFEMNDGFSVRSEINGMIRGLGFSEEDKERSISTLSGGQKTRVALAKLLLRKPSLIMLDEPTNHLDLRSIEWLEGFLQSYKGAVLIVAHDRYFLDRIVTKVFEIENGKLSVFTGDYSTYAARKKELRDTQMKAYLNQQAEIAHQEKVIDKLKSFNREKSIKRAESREKMLDKIELLYKPADIDDAMKLKITPSIISGRDVLSVSELSKGYDDMKLFEGVSFDIRRGERVAVIGDNGTGKTTLLKIITGNLEADNGSFSLGVNVKPGYYDQEHQVLHPDKTLFREISDDFPAMDNTKIRNTLAAFLFYGDDVFKQVSALSGGERGRLSLAKLMLGNANFLILDEPTNHLDITSKEILENALNEYEGTVLYVSHDRYFINRTATRILALEGGTFTGYPGNYDYYLEKRDAIGTAGSAEGAALSDGGTAGRASAVMPSGTNVSESKLSWQEQKAQEAEKRKRQNRIKKAEEEISRIEERIDEINNEMADPAISTDVEKLTALSKEADELGTTLERLYEEWDSLQSETE
ncbi:MAG: ABC-F family ATP-binding cassette domain-containing protein [Lachnospiraceae bacterium]|nr:ABC-F family ATP-binding cassette domain-containing protein [Lachnospiraceae bacterium]